MKASEIREFSKDELKAKLKQWREELFHSEFKKQTSELKDTSVFPKLRKDIARAMLILSEQDKGETQVASPKGPEDKGVKS